MKLFLMIVLLSLVSLSTAQDAVTTAPTEPNAVYTVEVTTPDFPGAGTNARVFITLIGNKGQSPKLELTSKGNPFERGSTDTFQIVTPTVGEISKLIVEQDGSGFAPGWYLEKITVYETDNPDHKWHFICNQWLAKDEGDGKLTRELDAEPMLTTAPVVQTTQATTAAPTEVSDDKGVEGLTVDCTREGMVAILDLKKFPPMDTNTMTLTNTSCKPKQVNKTHAVIEAPLDGCGTTHNSSDNYLYYYNSIKISSKKEENSSAITRKHEAVFVFDCAYDRSVILSVVSYSPKRKLVYTKTADFGNFTFTMDMYKSSKYQEAYNSYPVVAYLGQPMYLQVAAISKDSELVLFPERCFATPTNDVNDNKFYNFIDKGCSKDDTLKYNYNKEAPKQQFNLEAFRFLTDATNRVHLHCDLVVCRKSDSDSVCAKGCQAGSSRRRRAVLGDPPRQQLTIGPVDFAQVQSASAVAKGPFTLTTVAAITGCLALLALVLVVTIVIVYFRRRVPRVGAPTLLVQETEY